MIEVDLTRSLTSRSQSIAVLWTYNTLVSKSVHLTMNGIITLSTTRGKHYLSVKKAKVVELPFNPIEYVLRMSDSRISDWQIIWNW